MIRLCIEQGSAAREQAVLTHKLLTPTVEPQLLLWRYTEPAIVLGCSQRRSQRQWQALLRKHNPALPVVCRRAGGGAVLTGPWMLSATLLVVAAHDLCSLSLAAGFELFGRAWSKALNQHGVYSQLARPDMFAAFNRRAQQAGLDWICFAGLSHGELLDSVGRKMLGLAQIRRQQCSALVSGLLLQALPWQQLLQVYPYAASQQSQQKNQAILQQLTGSAAEQQYVSPPGSSLRKLLEPESLYESLGQSLRRAVHTEFAMLAGCQDPLTLIARDNNDQSLENV